MTKHVSDVKFEHGGYQGSGKTDAVAVFPSFRLTYSFRDEKWHNEPAGVWFECLSLDADPKFMIDAHEKALMQAAVERWRPLRKAFEKNSVEGARQTKAVDLIEKLFKTPEPVPSEPPKPMAEPDLSMFAEQARGL